MRRKQTCSGPTSNVLVFFLKITQAWFGVCVHKGNVGKVATHVHGTYCWGVAEHGCMCTVPHAALHLYWSCQPIKELINLPSSQLNLNKCAYQHLSVGTFWRY